MKHSNKAGALRKELTDRISEIVEEKGSRSGFKTERVIYLDLDSFQLLPVNAIEIQYIGKNLMYSKTGHEYDFSDLHIERLAKMVDMLETL